MRQVYIRKVKFMGRYQTCFYGVMKFYDDDTGAKRCAISHLTELHFALAPSINPTGTPIIMTMSQDAEAVCEYTIKRWRELLRTQHLYQWPYCLHS